MGFIGEFFCSISSRVEVWAYDKAEKIKDKAEKIKDKVEDVKYAVEDAWDRIKDTFSRKKYDEDDIEDQVDVDAALADFKEVIKGDITDVEKDCMDSVTSLFSDLIEKTKDKFPDLVEIIENEQEKAQKELKGTVMKYVNEHLSKNDSKFLEVLKMNPGKAKEKALDSSAEQILTNAEKVFDSKLKKYAENVFEEFSYRLNTRIANQEEEMNKRIEELEKLQEEAEEDKIDVEALKEKCAPIMESAECMIQVLGMEM